MPTNTNYSDENPKNPIINRKTVLMLSFTALLLAVSLLLVLFLIYSYNKTPATMVNKTLQLPTTTSFKSATVSPIPTNSVAKETVLSFNPGVLILQTQQTQNLNFLIDSGANIVAGVEMNLKFDPKTIEIVSITPAGFFTEPTVLIKKIDNNMGTVNFAIGSLKSKSGTGNLITLIVKGKQIGKSQITYSEPPLVSAIGENINSALKSAAPAIIEVK